MEVEVLTVFLGCVGQEEFLLDVSSPSSAICIKGGYAIYRIERGVFLYINLVVNRRNARYA